MGKITAIRPQRRPGRYNIMVDDTFAIAISEKVLVDLHLTLGKELDEAHLAEAARAEDASKALNAALRLLEVRPRSESEIRTRLDQHGYGKPLIDEIIAKLRGYGFVDDVQFTNAWIESRSRSQPAGVHKLRSELSQKGVAKETIETAISEISDDDQFELASKALKKRTKPDITTFEERQAAYARDAGYLARRGFGWNTIKTVLKDRYGRVEERDQNEE